MPSSRSLIAVTRALPRSQHMAPTLPAALKYAPRLAGVRQLSSTRAVLQSSSAVEEKDHRMRYSTPSTPINLGINFVPNRSAWILERFGKFHKILEPGLNFAIPFVDQVAYVQSLKEIPIEIKPQLAITGDNVGIELDGILYVRVVDPYKASYGVDDAIYATAQLAQTTMRSEIGSMTLDQSLKERATLNARITNAVNESTNDWGIRVMRYEIKNINPPDSVVNSMHLQVSAERTKRARVLEAEGKKQAAILVSEADKIEAINVAQGEAEATLLKAKATAQALREVGNAIAGNGEGAASLRVAERWMDAFSKLAKEGNTVVIPADVGSPASFIAQATKIFGSLSAAKLITQTAPEEPIEEKVVSRAE